MSRKSDQVFQESRHGLRIKENIPVKWSIKDSQLSGRGKVLNISTSGMLLEAQTDFTPIDRCFFAIESLIKGKGQFIPSNGRLVWCQRKLFNNGRVLCGIEFVEPTNEVITQLRERIQKGISHLASMRRLKSVVGVILILVMVAMTAFIIKQFTDNYHSMQISHQNMLTAYQKQQSMTQTVSGQLAATKGILTETEKLLSVARAETASLQGKVTSLQSTVASSSQQMKGYEDRIAKLQATNAQLSGEVSDLKQRLLLLDENISTLSEGRERIVLFKKKIRGVKVRMRDLNRQAWEAKVAAQKESDRLDSLIGNNGYFVRDGKPHKPDPEALKARQKIKIDVQFVD